MMAPVGTPTIVSWESDQPNQADCNTTGVPDMIIPPLLLLTAEIEIIRVIIA